MNRKRGKNKQPNEQVYNCFISQACLEPFYSYCIAIALKRIQATVLLIHWKMHHLGLHKCSYVEHVCKRNIINPDDIIQIEYIHLFFNVNCTSSYSSEPTKSNLNVQSYHSFTIFYGSIYWGGTLIQIFFIFF